MYAIYAFISFYKMDHYKILLDIQAIHVYNMNKNWMSMFYKINFIDLLAFKELYVNKLFKPKLKRRSFKLFNYNKMIL